MFSAPYANAYITIKYFKRINPGGWSWLSITPLLVDSSTCYLYDMGEFSSLNSVVKHVEWDYGVVEGVELCTQGRGFQ